MITICQHGAGEPAGYLEMIFREKGAEYRVVRLYEGEELPPETGTSLLIVLGGRMSANDEREYPFLNEEKDFIRRCIMTDVPVLGICLGAQMIASALSRKVYPSIQERGWCDLVPLPNAGPFAICDRRTVFQWHNETFELPAGAELLAQSRSVPHQMFAYKSALGVQFHIEVTREIILAWARDCTEADRNLMLAGSDRHLPASERLCRTIVDEMLRRGGAS
jgi:GMP synthase (glutamine-hydrolysing)